MLYKESAIAVMVAVMLGAASILGGLSIAPVLAAEPVTSKTISQADGESMIVDKVELNAKDLSARTRGTIIVEIFEGTDKVASGRISTEVTKMLYSPVEVDVNNVNITGSFDIVVEYTGDGMVAVNNIDVIEGTTIAEAPPNDGDDDTTNPPPDDVETEQPEDLDNVIKTKTISQEDDESMTIESVEFTAKKLSARTSGALTIAIVQDGKILESDRISTNDIKMLYYNHEATFGDLEVTGDFDVVFSYLGDGMVAVSSINVVSETGPAEDPGTNNPPPPGDTVTLTVNAVDQTGSELTGMWIEVYSGMSASGEPLFTGDTPEAFELEPGDYVVAVADFENNIFQEWDDSRKDRTREATLTTDETFTAIYSTDGSQPPDDNEDPTTPPPSAGPGSIVVYAHRIPSPNWGPTFTSASAGMWYVLYNSTGWLVDSGFYDEEGTTITGLNDGETYYVYATDCDECHGDPHDVVFDHWEDNTTENPRAITTGNSAHAHYRYEPDP